MQKTISTAEARRTFSHITDEVAFNGVEYIILKNGKVVAKLVPGSYQESEPDELMKWAKETVDLHEDDLRDLANA